MKKIKITDLILLVLSLVLCIGVKLLFPACDPKEDGSWMACHWAEQAVFACGIALAVMSLLRFFVDLRMKKGIALAMIPAAAIAALIPNLFIRLCMMQTMQCHAKMRPAVIICCVLIVLAAGADLVQRGKKENT